ncbi:aminotransferase [Oceanobacillus limi]|uniref:Aminotransferase n=1 Tax=Oceanobacillus limi TaxID=930131 RepID=A0A1I0D8P5_9BACI|nr:aminotransferase A [Oceanobacillus limi]SET28631.1 aminotransferase [Oceanobacillus limi]
MQHLLNTNVKNIEISGIRKFFNLVAGEQDVISLTIGQPDFYTPAHIKSAAVSAVENNKTSYTPNAGIIELRKAITAYYEENYEVVYDPESEVIVTTGASQAIDITFRTILNPGDEVILPGPIYPGYEPLITLAGASPVYVDTTKDNFKLTKTKLEKSITEKTKCIVLPYPSNPTGASYSYEELQEIVSVMKSNAIFILADEIYSELVYEQKHISIAGFEEVKEQTIIVNGLSKSHAMTGFRLGYTLAPQWLSQQMLKVHQYNVTCATSISQYAGLQALRAGKDDAIRMREAYLKRRNYVYDRLVNMGLEVGKKPEGAFYFFIKFPCGKLNSFQLGLDLVRKGKVALVPGSSFSSIGEGYMRLSYAYDMDTLKQGLDRLEDYLNNVYE